MRFFRGGSGGTLSSRTTSRSSSICATIDGNAELP